MAFPAHTLEYLRQNRKPTDLAAISFLGAWSLANLSSSLVLLESSYVCFTDYVQCPGLLVVLGGGIGKKDIGSLERMHFSCVFNAIKFPVVSALAESYKLSLKWKHFFLLLWFLVKPVDYLEIADKYLEDFLDLFHYLFLIQSQSVHTLIWLFYFVWIFETCFMTQYVICFS